MMNAIALCLVLSSLVAAGIRSPPPPSPSPLTPGLPSPVQIKKDEVIVKEGHRPVEIEYAQDGGITKVKISPQEKEVHADSSSASSQQNVDEKNGHKERAMEQVCDAFGKCKDKLAGAVGRSQEVSSERAHDVKDKVGEVQGEAQHSVGETLETVADATKGKAHELADKAGEAKEKVKEAALDAARSTKEKLQHVSKEAIKTADTLQKDVRGNSTEYLLPLLSDSFLWASSSLNLLGLSLAYGVAVWVTFISGYITADALPRQQFAVLQSKLYTVYFKVVASGIAMALLSHCLTSAEWLQALNLFASLAVVLFNLKFMEPRANKLMFDTMKLEKEEGRGLERPTDEPSVVRNIDSLVTPLVGKSRSAKASENPSENPERRADSSSASRSEMVKMSEKLKKLNFYSSILNIAVLVSLTFHLFHLGQMLQA